MSETELLAEAFPAPDDKAIAEAEARVGAGYRQPRSPAARRRAPLIAAGLSVLVAAAAAAAFLLVSAGDDAGSTAMARQWQRLVSAAARESRSVLTGPNVWVYRKIHADYGVGASGVFDGRSLTWGYHAPELAESWTAANGERIDCGVEGPTRFYSVHDRAQWIQAGRPALTGAKVGAVSYDRFHGSPTRFAGVATSALPTTVTGIAALVRTMRYHDPNAVLDAVHELFLTAEVAPATRAAILGYLEHDPGLTLIDPVRTHAGRVGIGIAVSGNGYTGSKRWVRRMLILDPRSSALIGYREVLVGKEPFTGARPGQGDGAWEDDLALGLVRHAPASGPARGKVVLLQGTAAAAELCAAMPRP
jgi:hypothetical protein